MQARADRKKKKEDEKDGVVVATAKLAVSTMTGHVVAQQVAVTAVEGARASQVARTAARASMLDYVPGGDYAKLATGQKLSRADSLAMLGQHGGRELAEKNGLSPHKPKRTSAMFSAVAASARKRQEQALTESIGGEPGKERGWARDERRKLQERRNQAGTNSDGSSSTSEHDSMSHPTEKDAKIDQAERKPGTQLEETSEGTTKDGKPLKGKEAAPKDKVTEADGRLTPEQYEEMKRLEAEKDPGPTLRPY